MILCFWSPAFLSSNVEHGNGSGLWLFPWMSYKSSDAGLNIGAILWFNKEGDTTSPRIPGLFSLVVFWCVFFCFFVRRSPLKKKLAGNKLMKKLVYLSRFDCKSHGYRWSTLAGDWCHPFALCVPWRRRSTVSNAWKTDLSRLGWWFLKSFDLIFDILFHRSTFTEWHWIWRWIHSKMEHSTDESKLLLLKRN